MSDDPALLSAEDMLFSFARRRLSPVDVLQAVTERVARFNPHINAFACLNPDAARQARESAARWRAGRPIGPLDGVPTTVKDLVDVAGFPTRRGSRTTDPTPVQDDAPMVAGLKAAGAVILGKTTTTEFGWKTPGDNPLHGITRNPWNGDYTPGGSSCTSAPMPGGRCASPPPGAGWWA
jgi:aspartyl-tRNA(Asn)/glutamyl-tRNA(Gln) amidotransferase subunit A